MWRVIPQVSSAVLLSTALLYYTPGAMAGELFYDDFNDGDVQDGHPVSWSPGGFSGGIRDASSGDLVITNTFNSTTYVVSADNMYDDVSIQSQLRITGPEPPDVSTAGVFARSLDDDAILASVSSTGVMALATYIDGTYVTRSQLQTAFRPMEGDVHLQLDVAGSRTTLTAWPTDAPQLSRQVTWQDVDGAFPHGSGHIGVWQSPPSRGGPPRPEMTTTYRYFAVVPEPSTGVLAIALWMATAVIGHRHRRRVPTVKHAEAPPKWRPD